VWVKLPLLFDLFTVGFLFGGCILLWLSLRLRSEVILPTMKEIGDPKAKENVGAMVERRREEFESKEGFELQAQSVTALLNAAPAQELDAHEGELSTEQNKYARSVSAAIAKSRKPPASV
jgi:hypothetical protein